MQLCHSPIVYACSYTLQCRIDDKYVAMCFLYSSVYVANVYLYLATATATRKALILLCTLRHK